MYLYIMLLVWFVIFPFPLESLPQCYKLNLFALTHNAHFIEMSAKARETALALF